MTEVVPIETLEKVLSFYNCSLNNSSISPLGNGLINSTFLVRSTDTTFVLQKLNHHVFKQPIQVFENADLINQHLLSKKQSNHYSLSPIWQLKTKSDETFIKIDNGFWRAILYIPNCYTVESVENIEQAEQVAKAFAEFTAALSDFPAKKLHPIIPNFHKLSARIELLKAAVKNNPVNRLSQCQELVEFCLAQTNFVNQVAQFEAKLPVQVTHNDTKINNLLFSSHTRKPLAVIDLDTCMPGFLMHDFGDMVRTCCSNLAEDATDLENMTVKKDILFTLITSYIQSFGDKITELEKQSLVIGAQLLPFMIGIRFLTDYLDGDNYFHVKFEQHNLDRAYNQIQLFRLIHELTSEMTQLIDEQVKHTIT